MNKELTEALEKYLLAIFELSKENTQLKVKDVSKYLKIGGSTTSETIKTLAKKGFIDYEPYSTISLTKKGIDAVELKIYRHNTISKFLNRKLSKLIQTIYYNFICDMMIWIFLFLFYLHQIHKIVINDIYLKY